MAKRPWLHTFVGNLKRMIPGTYHHASPQPLDGHLAELAYRANRRRREASLSDRLIETALADKCRTCRE